MDQPMNASNKLDLLLNKFKNPLKSFKNKNMSPVVKFFTSFLSVLLIIVTITGTLGFFFAYIPGKKLLTQVYAAKIEAQNLKQAIVDKDLIKAKDSINKLKQDTKNIESTYKRLRFVAILPIANNYYKDGARAIAIAKDGLDTGDILINAIEPYTDFLGMKGSSVSSAKTTEDRITFLTNSIEGLVPHLDTIEKKMSNIETSLNQIDANRYPEEFKGFKLKSTILSAQETIVQTHQLVKNDQPLLAKIPWLLGKDKPRQYLMIFQNDKELRPSGGFWTAYGSLTVKDGQVTPGTASNIYDLDDKINSKVPAPRLIKSYHINVPILNLRDSNLSPDFPTDAQIFAEQYAKAMGKKEPFDAVIAIDTTILVDMVKILGKLDTRVGTFTANPDKRCDGCPSIIYDLEWISGRPRNYIEKNRKDFMNPLMSALLANVMGSEKSKMTLLIEAALKDINEKHVMFYFPDPEMQKIGNLANITGKITDTDKSVDYFHLNDANFASAKSNIFITQKIKHEITIKDGIAQHKIAVTYTNPSPASNCNLEKGDLCLNASKYRNLFRFYAPVGSKLIKMTGTEVEPVQYEELDKQVFEGFYGNKYPLYAQSSLKTSVEYTSGATVGSTYTLLLQKQPGTKPVDYELYFNGKKQETFSWVADKTVKLSL